MSSNTLPSSSPIIKPYLYHAAASLSSLLLPYFLHLPSLSLSGLHTYIHPDSTPSSSLAAIKRPSDSSTTTKPRSRSKLSTFDESKAQLFRLRLSHSHLLSRLLFPTFLSSFLISSLSLSNLFLSFTIRAPSLLFVLFSSLLALSYLLFSLFSLSLHPSSPPTPLLLLLLLLPLASAAAIHLSDFHPSIPLATSSALAAAALLPPSSRAARSFWLATDQLRWNLSVISSSTLTRLLLYISILLNLAAPLLWFKPVIAVVGTREYRVRVLAAAAVAQIVAVRGNLQMYLNEAVLCWYQRLHASRVPDLDYGRAKVFLHNHYVCAAVMQLFAPPVVVVILVLVSQLQGNLFGEGMEVYSDWVKELALFFGWWIMFIEAVFVVALLGLYRCRVLLVS